MGGSGRFFLNLFFIFCFFNLEPNGVFTLMRTLENSNGFLRENDVYFFHFTSLPSLANHDVALSFWCVHSCGKSATDCFNV